MNEDARNVRLRRLRFRAWHRGTRELDLLIGSFADTHLEEMSERELDLFEALMEMPEPDAYAWIAGAADAPEPDMQALVEKLRKITLTPSDFTGKT